MIFCHKPYYNPNYTNPNKKNPDMSQPHFEGSVKSPLTLPKMGLGSPQGFPKTQSAIAGVKTPRIEAFFLSLERS